MIVDAWMQHPSPRFLAHDMFESLRRWGKMGDAPDTIPIEFTLGAMDAAKVERGILCAWYGPEGPLITNDEVGALVAAHPDRFTGLASVDIREPVAAVDELRRCVNELGLRGLRVLPWLWETPPDDRRLYPLYVACVELDIPFCLQVGHTGPLRPSEFGRPIPYLDRVALDFPQLRIVGGHIGYPWTLEMIALAEKYPNVYIDTSAYKPRRYPADLVQWMRKRGRDKVLFGSNWPMIAPADCLKQLDALELDDEASALFLGGNALRVFGIGA
jgi:predicted TIM-barrel fold metal-dependent hydrolase